MFELTQETKAAVTRILREKFDLLQETDEEIGAVIDEVVDTVKKQFGF